MSVQRGPQGNAQTINSEIEIPNSEIKFYFCGVKSALPTALHAHFFTVLNNRTTGTLTIQFFCNYDHQLHQVACDIIAG
jgi:hypothetical protein